MLLDFPQNLQKKTKFVIIPSAWYASPEMVTQFLRRSASQVFYTP